MQKKKEPRKNMTLVGNYHCIDVDFIEKPNRFPSLIITFRADKEQSKSFMIIYGIIISYFSKVRRFF